MQVLDHYDLYKLEVSGNELCILLNALEQLNDRDLTCEARDLKNQLKDIIDEY